MKTLTKKQLVDILDQVPDENPVYIYVEIGDVDLARRYVPAGVTLLRLGLPGDHSIDDSGVGLYVEILGKAQLIHERPTNVYWCGHVGWPGGVRSTSEVAPGSGVLLIEANSEGLARWVIDCINAAVDGVEFAAPRPEGAIFKRGRFRIYEDHKMSARSPVRDSMGYGGMVAARSRNAKRLKALARRLNALINAL